MAHLLRRMVLHMAWIAVPRARAAWGLAPILVVVILATGGCGCGNDRCGEPGGESVREPTIITGAVTAVNSGQVSVQLDDGTTRIVDVSGRTWALETGRRYRFPTFEDDNGRLVAAMPSRCGCGQSVTEADGDPVDTSLWGWVERRLARFVTGAGLTLASVVVVWGLARFVTRWWEERLTR